MMNRILFALFIIPSLVVSAYCWDASGGEPLYADAVASYDSISGWTDGPISVCPGWLVYFKALGPGGTEASLIDYDFGSSDDDYYFEDEVTYLWGGVDSTYETIGNNRRNAYKTYNTEGLYYSILTVDDVACIYAYPDAMALDTVCVYVCTINNPHIGDANLEKDLTYRLPYAGTFTYGTAGWQGSVTGGTSFISYTAATEGWVGLSCSTVGGTATLSFPSTFYVNMADASTIVDEIKVFVKYRLNYPTSRIIPDGSTLEILLYGDNTTNNLPIALRKDFHHQSFEQSTAGFREDSFCVTAIPQTFHRISNMVLRYTGGAGEASELQIDQIYLSVSRVQQ
jgi:hypothetical protein